MAQLSSLSGLKLLFLTLGLGFFVYILGPPLYWHFTGDEPGRVASCPQCVCDCPNDGLSSGALADLRGVDVSLPDCAKNDPDILKELKESKYKQLQQEMKIQEKLADETQTRLQEAQLEAKKTASQAQKELEKCNAGMETSEGSRERAEALLAQVKKTAEMWEARAIAAGWKEVEAVEKVEDPENTEDVEDMKDRPDGKKLKSRDAAKPKKSKSRGKSSSVSKKNKKEIAELQTNLAVAQYLVQRAVNNEMGTLEVAQKHARELSLM